MTTAYDITKKLYEAHECLRLAREKGLESDPSWLVDIERLKYDVKAACNWLDYATGLHSKSGELYDFYVRRLNPQTADVAKVDNYIKEEFDVR